MRTTESFELYGYLELFPTNVGFITPIFTMEGVLYVENVENDMVTHFDKLPEQYIELVKADITATGFSVASGDRCCYAFKWNQRVFWGNGIELVSVLRTAKSDFESNDFTYTTIEKFLNNNRILTGQLPFIFDENIGQYAHNERVIIDTGTFSTIIGPVGRIILEIERETSTIIFVDEYESKGYVKVFSDDKENLDMAVNRIKDVMRQPEIGETYEGTVKSIMPFGAFIEFMPGKQGLLHITEVSYTRLDSLEGVLEEGDKLQVKLIGTDPKTGKYRLSRKALMDKPEKHELPKLGERSKGSQLRGHPEGHNSGKPIERDQPPEWR